MKNSAHLEYKMTKQMFNALLNERNGEEKKLNPYAYVMSVVNNNFGLRGEVKRVIIVE